ncbi:polysaccharide biosynthesis protein [Wenzhouxiangella sp. XN79A]|uniref:polysaccharide biosynthesis protein n=1 Tax=Wenzhouxiangella sp. XN79A TaxID=2724193 RepID=UPI00144A8657|nr:nucleoside-diphosphate sugar epimerase/dehydratase [Wenzhouxiangella sp. XN79A]NKI35526.1 polysaccharide biosynthesis protein [Wenzhouxiangella sp. XN79A]
MNLRALRRAPRYHNIRAFVIVHDLLALVVAWLAARWVAAAAFEVAWPSLLRSGAEIALLLGLQALIYWRVGLYRGLWRFASLPDLGNLVRASLLGAVAAAAVLLTMDVAVRELAPMLWLYPTLLLLALGLPRLVFRTIKDMRTEVRWRRASQRTLILGAGRSARLLLPELRRRGGFEVVGFLDDSSRLRNTEIDGVPVIGGIDRLPRVVREAAIDLAVIAIPSATNTQMQRIVERCEQAGVEFKTLPTLKELGASITRFEDLKPVAIDDLLGRDPVSLDWNAIRSGLAGKRVLVTGGGGSIGAELCRQIARLDPAGLVVLDSSEYNLYRIDYRLRKEFRDLVVDTVLGDVCDPATVERMVSRHKPQVIFHAAAYKHLPMLQNQVREAFRNNVIGTVRMADAAQRHGVSTFVLISTDKAVNPCNVMGATKRVAELYCQSCNRESSTRFITVRFGNVLNSTGSVVPLFNEQIRAGGPVTVTHPEISRYFMTIAEAGQLIMQAAVLGEGGEVFVLDMGEPVRISYLAEQLIRLAGKEPGRDIEIVYTGLRPGEKLFEELFHEHEAYAKTGHEKILLARNAHTGVSGLADLVKRGERAVREYDSEAIRDVLMALVPELERVPPRERKVIPLG